MDTIQSHLGGRLSEGVSGSDQPAGWRVLAETESEQLRHSRVCVQCFTKEKSVSYAQVCDSSVCAFILSLRSTPLVSCPAGAALTSLQ